ncbi:hypothetical protein BGW39_006812 [Mortierella sp. 14UC]|nr:hypothetical protein BGW39_006812 [Mortierella sp. 14UC]
MNVTLPPCQVRVLQTPELLEAIGAHLTATSFRTCIRVCKYWNDIFIPMLWNTIDDSLYAWPDILHWIDDDPRVLDIVWLRDIFVKYGKYIRHLIIRWRILIDVAYQDNKACTNLLSIKVLNIKHFHTFMEKRAVCRMKYRTRAGVRRYPSQRHSPAITGPIIAPGLEGVFEPTAILLKTEENQLNDWMTQQCFWMLLRGNPGLRLISLHAHLGLLSNLKSLGFIYDTFAMLPSLSTLVNPLYHLEYETLWKRVPSLRNYSSRLVPPPMPAATFDPIGPFWNLRSLTITSSIPLMELDQILRSIPYLAKLRLFNVHPNIDTTPLSSTKEESLSESFTLKSLTIDSSSTTVLQSPGLANYIFRRLPELNELCFIHLPLDVATTAALFCPKLEHARQICDGDSLARGYFPKHDGRFHEIPIPNSQASLFQSCRYLRIFDAIQYSFDADHISNSVWVCEGLEVFRCQIVGLSRLDQDEHSVLSYITESGLREDECSTEEQRVLTKARTCKDQHEAVYDQLARFTKLRVLDLGYEYRSVNRYSTRYTVAGNEYRDYGGLIPDTLQLSLSSGLGRLATLGNLQVFGFEGVDHEMDLLEIEWIAVHWPRLREMRGIQKDDHLGYVKPDKFRRTLREAMQSLCPDVRHASGKK